MVEEFGKHLFAICVFCDISWTIVVVEIIESNEDLTERLAKPWKNRRPILVQLIADVFEFAKELRHCIIDQDRVIVKF